MYRSIGLLRSSANRLCRVRIQSPRSTFIHHLSPSTFSHFLSLYFPTPRPRSNQSPPVDGKPSLMTFREVTTLFHEAGHGLQHMLTEVDEGMVSGIRGIEW